MISNRGVKVWPAGKSETFCSDHWRCRFMAKKGSTISHQQIVELLAACRAGFDLSRRRVFANFDGERGYSLDQGE